MRTKDIVQTQGFESLYVDADSVFLKKRGASFKDFEHVTAALAREIDLPIS
jgi:DNA polymerase elongation subunit (family B)